MMIPLHKWTERLGLVIVPLLVLLGFAASSHPVRAQAAPQYAAIDHVGFFVTDLDRTLAFYTRVFGADVWKNRQTERRYLVLGASYIAIEERATSGIDHFCLGIDNFDIDAVHAFLDMQNIPWQDYPGGDDLHVDDRNGIRTQLALDDTWSRLSESAAIQEANASAEPAIFRPLALDEVFLTVTNLEVDSLFYSRLLNQTGSLQAGSLWFKIGNARLRLTQAPVGQAPGLNYFSVLVSSTNLEEAAEAVFAAGGIIETILPNGFSFWDPDGHRVLVRTAPLVGAPPAASRADPRRVQ